MAAPFYSVAFFFPSSSHGARASTKSEQNPTTNQCVITSRCNEFILALLRDRISQQQSKHTRQEECWGILSIQLCILLYCVERVVNLIVESQLVVLWTRCSKQNTHTSSLKTHLFARGRCRKPWNTSFEYRCVWEKRYEMEKHSYLRMVLH